MIRRFWIFPVLGLLLLPTTIVEAKGKGPVGVWAASNDIVLVADSSLPGIVVVSLSGAVATERLMTLDVAERVVGIGSCLQCKFLVVTAALSGKMIRVDFAPSKGTVADILARPNVNFFDGATVTNMIVDDKDGNLEETIDPRMVVVEDGGGRAFTASSRTSAVYKMNLLKSPVKLERVFHQPRVEPFGIAFDRNGKDFLIAMHKNIVQRITPKGKVLESYDLLAADCPGIKGGNAGGTANLRAAIDDPLDAKSSVLVLASKPRTYDAVVWKLNFINNTCEAVAGKVGPTSGWLDGVGDEIRFSRPHHMTLLPPPSDPTVAFRPTLVITDIDNRSLRLVDLQTRQSQTITYDRDRRALNEPPLDTGRKCSDLEFLARATPTFSIRGEMAYADEATLFDVKYRRAKNRCKRKGMRLCEPSELRDTGVASDLVAWTNAKCASCWQKNLKTKCEKKLSNVFEPPGGTHGTKGFVHSWNSGVAYEIGADLPNGPATICHDFKGTDNTEQEVRAAAVCCADC